MLKVKIDKFHYLCGNNFNFKIFNDWRYFINIIRISMFLTFDEFKENLGSWA